MGDRADTLLQSPVSCRNAVSCFLKWCNHKMFLPVGLGLSLADMPGLLQPRDSVLLLAPGARRRADLAGVTHVVRWILSPLAAWVPPPVTLSTKTQILTWLRSHHLGVMGTSRCHPLVGHGLSVPPAQPRVSGLTHKQSCAAEAGPAC